MSAAEYRDLLRIGGTQVQDDEGALSACVVQGKRPDLVVTPQSVEALSAVMAACHRERIAVVPFGGGTKQTQGRPPALPFVAVCTVGLDRVLQHEPADLTISVQAGMTLSSLAMALAGNGLMLPVDVPLPQRATVGGVLATAADGPRRLGYGTLRDLLIGIGVVEATGRRSKAGGMVVKNVSGFDMMKLYLGSLGSLAVIASANFKLIPCPRATTTLLASFDSPEGPISLAGALRRSQLTPVAVEWLCQMESHPHAVALRAEGMPKAVARHLREGTTLMEQAGATSVSVLSGPAQDALWARIADLPQTAEIRPGEVVLRLGVLPACLGPALRTATRLCATLDLSLVACARALCGVAYLRVHTMGTDPLPLLSFTGGLCGVLRQTAPGAALSILGAAPDLSSRLPSLPGQPPGLAQMRRIKDEFDPQGILNPGRLLV